MAIPSRLTYPYTPRQPRTIYHRSPERVAFPTGDYTWDGKPLWADRPWEKGERAEYCRTVLLREPGYGEA